MKISTYLLLNRTIKIGEIKTFYNFKYIGKIRKIEN